MQTRPACTDAQLDSSARWRPALATAIRERKVTKAPTTVVRPARWFVTFLATALLAACGGGSRGDTYAKATDVQGQCCNHLAGDARDQCNSEIVRVDDTNVAQTSVNQDTYACITTHFQCDPSTGHPTQASAQKQLECIQDLDGEGIATE